MAQFSSPPAKKAKTENEPNIQAPFSSPPQCCPSLTHSNGNTSSHLEIQSTSTITTTQTSTQEQDVRSLMLKEAGYDIDNPSNTKKRQDYISWDDYFMAISFLSAQRSKDPQVQLGACIVDEDNRIVGIGYNGFPRGCSDDCLPWASKSDEANELHTKDPFMCHAEVNAILNKSSADVKGARMVSTVHNLPMILRRKHQKHQNCLTDIFLGFNNYSVCCSNTG